MFKKGLITDEVSQEFTAAVELACRYNLDGVEIRSVWEKGPHELDKKDIKEIKSIAGDKGLEICAISAPFYKCSLDNESEIRRHIDILKRCIELANELDTRIIRGFTFWRNGSFEENLDRIVSKFEKPLDILERENFLLALESDPSVFASDAAKLVNVIMNIDSPHIKALWDPGNDLFSPDNETPYPDGYEIIKPYIIHMHLKDAVKLHDGKTTGAPVGEGQVDYKGQFKRLLTDDYKGYVVLETHYRPKHEISDSLMALPKGSAFSYLGYEATEESLQNWERLMSSIQ